MDKQNNNNPSVNFGDGMNGFGPDVSGSAAYIAAQRKDVERQKTEKLINDMKGDFPALARIYEMVMNK